jgi:TP901 family phage tail tape measure protein
MRELKLKYILELASNIGKISQAEAKVLEEAQKRMQDAVKTTNKDSVKLGEAVGTTTKGVDQLERQLGKLATNTSTQRQVTYMNDLGRAIDRNVEKAKTLRQVLAEHAAGAVGKLPEVAAGGYAAERVIMGPVKSFATLEQATMDLRVAMTDSKGKVSKAFDKISQEAVKLGNELPGTTKDFMAAALELKANGAADSVIANGGLRASSYLGVLLRMNQSSAAKMVAKTREAYGLKEDELVPAANMMQKARFAYGINPDDMLASNTYMANELNAVGWSGLGRMREVLAIQGMAAQRGMDGSVFGTDMKDFIGRLAMADTRLAKKSPEARHVRELMAQHGIGKFEVFGKDGQLISPAGVVKAMQPFSRLKPQDQIHAVHQIFGEQGGQLAQLLIQGGPKKFADMLAQGDSQGDLNTRLAMTTSTLANKFEALTGTIENFMAQIATPLGNGSKGSVDAANDWVGAAQGWVAGHPVAGTAGLLGAAGAAGTGTYLGAQALRTWILGRGAPAAAAEAAQAVAASNPFRGLGVSVPSAAAQAAEAAAKSRATWMTRGRWAGGALGALGFGVDAYGVLTDDNLTEAGKVRGLARAGVGAGGAWGGATAGAALGTMILPGIGTAIGGAIGGGLGYWGGGKGFDAAWSQDAKRDFVRVSAPQGAQLTDGPGGSQVLQVGEGKLDVNVHLTDERTSVTTNVTQPLSLVRINPGSTNPGGY